MKRILTFLAAFLLPVLLLAQTSQEDYIRRYNNLVNRVGPAGIGVETLLDKWAEEYPEDTQQLLARFSFWFNKCQTSNVIQLPQDRYLGREPLLPLTDSLGRKNNYFEDIVYEDESFGLALEALDKAVALEPRRLDLRLLRIDALTAYEKGSPDMALASLKALTDEHFKQHPAWTHESLEKVDDEVFKALLQDYCFTFFRLGTDSSAEAFKSLSEHMLTYSKDDPLFLDNLGSYWFVCKKEYKKARKYYDQVLKKHPDDITAIRNSILLARSDKNVKLEKKYLAMMAQYGATEMDRASAKAQLEALNQKR
jgi:tetratricopeptide (TPR) repeat protein